MRAATRSTRPDGLTVDRRRAARFWDEHGGGVGPETWFFHEPVRRYVNRSISGDENRWPLDWFESHLGGRRFARALSVGCGCGDLERDLLRRGICDRIDGFDVSLGSLAEARRQARDAGLAPRVRYFALDANEPVLPRARYDAVFCHQCLHHVAKLEKLFRALLGALVPSGVLYADELIGPSRHEWTAEAMAPAVAAYRDLVPAPLRLSEILPAPIVPADPSEGIRASEILPQLRVGFDIEITKPYGGNLLALICPHVDWPAAPAGLIEHLIDRETDDLARHGGSHCAIVVARPKGAWRARWAAARYFVEPKARRIGREIRASLGRILGSR